MRRNLMPLSLSVFLFCPVVLAQRPTPDHPRSHVGTGAPQPILQAPNAGVIEGFVYWDANHIAHKPASSCSGLAITVSAESSSGGPSPAYTPLSTTSNGFKYSGKVKQFLSGGKINVYDVCTYGFDHVPVGQNLQVKLTVSDPYAFSPYVLPQSAVLGPIKIVNGQCNMLPHIANPTASDLASHWGSCQNMAYDVNFLMQTPLRDAGSGGLTPVDSGSRTGMLSSAPRPGIVTPGTTQVASGSSGNLLPSSGSIQGERNPGPVGTPVLKSPGPAGTSSSPATPGRKVELNPQPLPPKQSTNGADGFSGSANIGGAGGFTGGVRPTLPAAFSGGIRVLTGNRVKNSMAVNSSIIAVLSQQKQTGPGSPGHTLASGSVSPIFAEPSNVRVGTASGYIPSSLLTAQENTSCQQIEAQGAAPAIFRIDGKAGGAGVLYSPDPQANPYTIVGCGFGNSPAAVVLGFFQLDGPPGGGTPVHTRNLTIQSWNDHEIVASLDPNTSGLPDWENVALLVTAKRAGESSKGSFFARRQTVLLAKIPQNQASLYQQGSPYFLSPVANYYGLDGTLGVMRQALPGPIAGQDQFAVQLSPGFVIESTQTDLLVSSTSGNVASKPASISGNTITVTYPVVSYGSGNSVDYYSIYGLRIWVTGPAGVNPQ
jgi:hypothetical protein